MSRLFLSEGDVSELLSPAEVLDAVEASLERLGRGAVEQAPRSRLPLADGEHTVAAAVDAELGYAGLAAAMQTPSRATALVSLFALGGGGLDVVVEAAMLRQLATAAASAAAARRLARPQAASLGVIGCGRQAAAQVACMREAVPTLARVVAYCRDRGRLERFCRLAGCDPASSHQEAAGQDIVVTATSARDPVLRGEWLAPGALVCAVGANDAASRELDNTVLARATFVCCDWREQARLDAGDLVEPIAQGVLDWLEVHALHEVAGGDLAGRAAPGDIVVFKACGATAFHLAAAARAVEIARRHGRGVVLGAAPPS